MVESQNSTFWAALRSILKNEAYLSKIFWSASKMFHFRNLPLWAFLPHFQNIDYKPQKWSMRLTALWAKSAKAFHFENLLVFALHLKAIQVLLVTSLAAAPGPFVTCIDKVNKQCGIAEGSLTFFFLCPRRPESTCRAQDTPPLDVQGGTETKRFITDSITGSFKWIRKKCQIWSNHHYCDVLKVKS